MALALALALALAPVLRLNEIGKLPLVDLGIGGGLERRREGGVGDEGVRCGLLGCPPVKWIEHKQPLQEVEEAATARHLVLLLLLRQPVLVGQGALHNNLFESAVA